MMAREEAVVEVGEGQQWCRVLLLVTRALAVAVRAAPSRVIEVSAVQKDNQPSRDAFVKRSMQK
jgi:hypothetical protein